MSTHEAVVAVLVAAIFANLVLAVGLIVGPRIRAHREAAYSAAIREAAGTGPRPASGAVPIAAGDGRPVSGRPASTLGSPVSAEPSVADLFTGFELTPGWSKWLAEEGARIDRYKRPATIVLVEIAGLDRIAERLGPEAADRLIPPIATTMRRDARASDNLARLGRTRFGALLTETDEIRAINYVERVRSACDLWLEAGAVALRLSMGWAEIAADKPVEVAIQAAEQRLNEERQRHRARADLESDSESDVQAAMHPVQA